MGRKSNVAALRRTHWTAQPAPQVSPEQKVLRVLYRERDRVLGRIAVLEQLIAERDRLSEQVTNIRDLAERVMEESDAKAEEIGTLTKELAVKDERIASIERAQQQQEQRLAQLEYSLKILTQD